MCSPLPLAFYDGNSGESKSVVWILNLGLVLTQPHRACLMHVKSSLAAGADSRRLVKKQKVGSADKLKIPRHHLISTATGSGWQVSGDYWRHVLVTCVWLLIFRQVGLLKEQISGDFCMRVSWSYGLDLDSQENDNFLPQEKCTSIMLPSMIWFDRWSDSLFSFLYVSFRKETW